ncbi:MAG: hypothetical protein ACK5YR_10145 [Pirellula sp.]|jgi:hypothetical protein
MIPFLHQQFAICCKKSTAWPRVLAALTFFVVWIAENGSIGSRAEAQMVETFDRVGPFFNLWRDDCSAQLVPRTRNEPGVETIEVRYKLGSYVHLAMPISPCALVDEFIASIRVRCGEGGIRLGVRVVYPRSTHPATSDPLSVSVFGNPGPGSGAWGTSTIRNVKQGLEQEERILRARFGSSLDLSEPYIDALVLDVYRNPGTTKLQVDDLLVEGMLPPQVTVRDTVFAPADMPTERAKPATVSEQLVSLQNSVPRWIQYQGESLTYLRDLGFSGVIVPRSDDELIAEQAAETGIAVIAPPPQLVPSDDLVASYEHVSAWMLGWELNDAAVPNTKTRISRLTNFPQSLSRPTIGEAMEMYGAYGRFTDWLAVPTPHPTRVRSSMEMGQIVQSDARSMLGRSSPLASIVTEMPPEWISQKAEFQRSIGGSLPGLPDTDLLQMRLAVYRGLMHGAKGWIFRSTASLDSGDPTNMARADGFRAINEEIELLSPWIRANQSPWTVVETNSSMHSATVLTTPNSQLVLVVAKGRMDQVCMVSPSTTPLRLQIPMTGQTRRVFRITHGQLEPLRSERQGDRLVVQIDDPSLIEQLITVVDPKPIEYLQNALQRKQNILMESRVDIAQQTLQIAQMTLGNQRLPAGHEHWEILRRAESLYREALRGLQDSQVVATLKAADQCIVLAQRIVRLSWEEASQQFTSLQSSPLLASSLSLPLHWELNRNLYGRPWQSQVIPGSSFTSWETLRDLGWTMDQRLQDRIATTAALAPGSTTNGASLILTSRPATEQPIPSGYGGTAMRVSTGRVSVPSGTLVHIQGQVKVRSNPAESQSGLLISDTLGGEAMGQLISSFDSPNEEWQQFGLFRIATNEDGFRVHFETRGEVTASITGLKAEFILPTRRGD